MQVRRGVEEVWVANDERTRFNRVAVGRRMSVTELKKEVNELCVEPGQRPRYPMALAKEPI